MAVGFGKGLPHDGIFGGFIDFSYVHCVKGARSEIDGGGWNGWVDVVLSGARVIQSAIFY